MPTPIRKGTTIERYRVKGRLGSGSMGDVYLGVDIGLDREVAIKILSERHRENRELRARFVREAKAVAAIAHPNVVQVFATGNYDGRPYIAMEFLDGTDLGSSIEESGRWSSLQTARAVRDAAKGLHAAAEAGLIHRDVKPSNLVLLRSGVVKVTDFGLAKPMEPGDQPALTALGVVVGTPDYIAPEQARGEKIDHRVDMYALGGTLYFLVTGMPPFRTGRPQDDKYLKVVARHLKNPPPDPRVRNPTADHELGQLCQRMMAKKASERPGYPELIAQLDAMTQRLERETGGSQSDARGRHSTGLGGLASPTPMVRGQMVGGQTPPTLDDDDDAAPTKVHMPSQGVAPLPASVAARRSPGSSSPGSSSPGSSSSGSRGPGSSSSGSRGPGSRGPGSSSPGPVPVASAAAAAGRAVARPQERPDMSDPAIAPPPGMPRWVWVVTVAAVLIFAVGGLLRLFGPLPSSASPAESAPFAQPPDKATGDRSGPKNNPGEPGSTNGAGSDKNARSGDPNSKAPEVPEGMLLVPRPDGSPWFLADVRPVTSGAYATMFPSHKAGKSSKQAVTNVSYGYARSYAEAKGKRLLSAEEWRAASKLDGFKLSRGLWEWVGEAKDGHGDEKPVQSRSGSDTRVAGGGKDVTFRLARDLK